MRNGSRRRIATRPPRTATASGRRREMREAEQAVRPERADDGALDELMPPERLDERRLVPHGLQVDVDADVVLTEELERGVETRGRRRVPVVRDLEPVRAGDDIELDDVDAGVDRCGDRVDRVLRRERRCTAVPHTQHAPVPPGELERHWRPLARMRQPARSASRATRWMTTTAQ